MALVPDGMDVAPCGVALRGAAGEADAREASVSLPAWLTPASGEGRTARGTAAAAADARPARDADEGHERGAASHEAPAWPTPGADERRMAQGTAAVAAAAPPAPDADGECERVAAPPELAEVALPSWLTPGLGEGYDPAVAAHGDGFLRKNVLTLTGLLARVRLGGGVSRERSGAADRLLARVAVPVRLVGVVAAVACVSASTNALVVYLALAWVLVSLALRPAPAILAVVRPAIGVAALAALLMVPAALFGQPSAPMRMGAKTFVTMSLVLGLSQQTPWNELVGGLRRLGLPSTVVLVLNLALKDIELLGRAALELSDALALRSVGVAHDRTGSAAGVMGMVFLRAHDAADRMSEAMACRGFDGEFELARERVWNGPTVVYAIVMLLVVVGFFVLEGAMR